MGGGVRQRLGPPRADHICKLATKTETTVEAIKGLWEQVDLMKKQPPTEVETEARQGPDPEFICLQLRHSREGSARAGDL